MTYNIRIVLLGGLLFAALLTAIDPLSLVFEVMK